MRRLLLSTALLLALCAVQDTALCQLLAAASITSSGQNAQRSTQQLGLAPQLTKASARKLLQDSEASEVTVVTSAETLLDAFVSGVRHIEIREHLDLTGLNISPSFRLGPVPATVKSIRCLILTRHYFPSGTTNIWLDKLYIRSATSMTETFGELLEVWGPDAQLWMTQVTLQGSGEEKESCEDCGLDVWQNADVYAEGRVTGSSGEGYSHIETFYLTAERIPSVSYMHADCIFADFAGVRVVRVFAGASVSLVRCTFLDNKLFHSNFGAAIIQADGDDRYGNSNVRLEGCTFSGNTPETLPALLADNRDDEVSTGMFYSDSPTPQICVYEGPDDASVPPPCATSSPGGLGAAGDVFLQGTHQWLQQVKQELEGATATTINGSSQTLAMPPGSPAAVAAARVPSPGSSAAPILAERDSVGAAVFAFVAVAAAVLLLMVAGLIVTLKRRRWLAAVPPGGARNNTGPPKYIPGSHRHQGATPTSPCRGSTAAHAAHAHAHAQPNVANPSDSDSFSVELMMPPTSLHHAATDTKEDIDADTDVIRPISQGRIVTFTVKSNAQMDASKRKNTLGRAWNLKNSSSHNAKSNEKQSSVLVDTEGKDPRSHPCTKHKEDTSSHHPRNSSSTRSSSQLQAVVDRAIERGRSSPSQSGARSKVGGVPSEQRNRSGSSTPTRYFSWPSQRAVSADPSQSARAGDTSSHPSAKSSAGVAGGEQRGGRETSSHASTKDSARAHSPSPFPRSSGTSSSPKDERTSSHSNPCAETSSSHFRGTNGSSDPGHMHISSFTRNSTEPSFRHLASIAHRPRTSSPSSPFLLSPKSPISPGARSRMHAPRHMRHSAPMHADFSPSGDATLKANSASGLPDEVPPVATIHVSVPPVTTAHDQWHEDIEAPEGKQGDKGPVSEASNEGHLTEASENRPVPEASRTTASPPKTPEPPLSFTRSKMEVEILPEASDHIPDASENNPEGPPPPCLPLSYPRSFTPESKKTADTAANTKPTFAAYADSFETLSGGCMIKEQPDSVTNTDAAAASVYETVNDEELPASASKYSFVTNDDDETAAWAVSKSYDSGSERHAQGKLAPRKQDAEEAEQENKRDGDGGGEGGTSGDVLMAEEEEGGSRWSFELPLPVQPDGHEQGEKVVHSMELEDIHEPRTEPPKKPRSVASTAAWLEYISQQLDGYGPTPLLIHRFELLGPNHRCVGGQGVIQFARRIEGNNLYAIKFFARVRNFQEESEIYRSSPLRRFMPSVSRMERNADGAIKDPFGKPLAPFIVMDKGESLQELVKNGRVDVFTAAQVLGHISQTIAELHDSGYVHRDLKPGSIMWQPRTYTWVLIDFGLAARIDRTARVGCTPAYAAPETASALQRRQRTTNAEAAIDAWALGVIAFELLLKRPAFGLFVSVEQIFGRLIDPSQTLPWEEGCLTHDDKRKLGKFRKPLLQLLKRKPSERATAKDFCKKMSEIYSCSPSSSRFRGSMPKHW